MAIRRKTRDQRLLKSTDKKEEAREMRPFRYTRANDAANAVQTVIANANSKFLAGGTNLLDLMKEDVERPDELVDITRLDLTQIRMISDGASKGGVSIGGTREKYRDGESSSDSAKLPALDASYLSGRFGANPQYGIERRKLKSKNTLFLLLRCGFAMQQARTWNGLRST